MGPAVAYFWLRYNWWWWTLCRTFSPATLFGLTPFMMQTDSITIFTPIGGLCMARTSTTSFLFNDFKLANAASYKIVSALHVIVSVSTYMAAIIKVLIFQCLRKPPMWIALLAELNLTRAGRASFRSRCASSAIACVSLAFAAACASSFCTTAFVSSATFYKELIAIN